MILDLLFSNPTTNTKSVNTNTIKTSAPMHSMPKLSWVLLQIIAAPATAPLGPPFLFAKLNVKDSFWRMVVLELAEYNSAYILPTANRDKDNKIQIVVPTALQMGGQAAHFSSVPLPKLEEMLHRPSSTSPLAP